MDIGYLFKATGRIDRLDGLIEMVVVAISSGYAEYNG